MAHTEEGAHGVHTLPVSTQSPLRRTLIHICSTHKQHKISHKHYAFCCFPLLRLLTTDERTNAVTVVGVLEAGVTQTVVGAHCVLTGAVATRLSLTLVHI